MLHSTSINIHIFFICIINSFIHLANQWQGGNLNAKDKQNMSPLHRAAWKGQTEAAEYLLNKHVHMAEVDSSLKTALHWAVQFRHFGTLLALLKVNNAINFFLI